MPENISSRTQVVLRVRPFQTNTPSAIEYVSSTVIRLNKQCYTFDHVHNDAASQQDVFERSIASLVKRFIEGENVCIVAYGRPTSGKSFTLGTDANLDNQSGFVLRTMEAILKHIHQQGIKPSHTELPQEEDDVRHLPRRVQSNARLRPMSMVNLPRRGSTPNLIRIDRAPRFVITVSYVDIDGDTLHDLLEDQHEQTDQAKEVVVCDLEKLKSYLASGNEQTRQPGAHRVFTITVKQITWDIRRPPVPSSPSRKMATLPNRGGFTTLNVKEMIGRMEKIGLGDDDEEGEWTIQTSKLHLVDLAAAACGDDDILNLLCGQGTTPRTPAASPSAWQRVLPPITHTSRSLVLACVCPEQIRDTNKTIEELGRPKPLQDDEARILAGLRELATKLRTQVALLRRDRYDLYSPRSPDSDVLDTRSSNHSSLSSMTTTLTLPDMDDNSMAMQQFLLAELKQYVHELHDEIVSTREHSTRLGKILETSCAAPEDLSATLADAINTPLPEGDYDVDENSDRSDLLHTLNEMQSRLENYQLTVKELKQQRDALNYRVQDAMTQYTTQATKCQTLQDQVMSLAASEKFLQAHLDSEKRKGDELRKYMWDHEQGTQITLCLRLEELEKLKLDLNALRLVEEKQDAVIHGLETKNNEMSDLVDQLQSQLDEQDSLIDRLRMDNANKTSNAEVMKKQVESVLRDMSGMDTDKKQLHMVIRFLEGTLRQQDAKSDRNYETLQALQNQYSGRELELEEKRRTVELLSAQRDSLTQSLQKAADDATKHSKDLEAKMHYLEEALTEKTAKIKDLETKKHQLTQIEIQRVKALESRVEELDGVVARLERERTDASNQLTTKKNEIERLQRNISRLNAKTGTLEKKVTELEEMVESERALVREQDTTGLVAKLESQIKALEQAKQAGEEDFEISYEKALNDLEEARQEIQKQQQFIHALQVKRPHPNSPTLGDYAESSSTIPALHATRDAVSSPPQTPRASTSSPLPHLPRGSQQPSLGNHSEQELAKRQSNGSLVSDASGVRSIAARRPMIVRQTPSPPPVPSSPRQIGMSLLASPASPTLSTHSLSSDSTIQHGGHVSVEQYETMIANYQRRLRQSEEDAKARQEAVARLKTQLSQHEEKSRQFTEEWRTKLEQERQLKFKAERARSILERRMEDLMNKRNRFICF